MIVDVDISRDIYIMIYIYIYTQKYVVVFVKSISNENRYTIILYQIDDIDVYMIVDHYRYTIYIWYHHDGYDA